MKKRLVLIVLAMLSVVVAYAQAKFDVFDEHCANITLLQSKAVQNEIKLTESQRSRLNVHAQWHRSQLEALDKLASEKKLNENAPEIRNRLDQVFDTMKERCLGELTAVQVKRLRELTIQQLGESSLCDPVVAKKVGMSAGQLQKMQATYKDGARKFSEIEREEAQRVLLPYKDIKPKDEADARRLQQEVQGKLAAAGARIRPKLQGIRKNYADLMLALLTPPQKKAYLLIRGKPAILPK